MANREFLREYSCDGAHENQTYFEPKIGPNFTYPAWTKKP
jgi:hypothetical protein